MIEPKTEREWRATTGLDEKRFEKLLESFEKGYQLCYGRSLEDRQADNPAANSTFKTCRELLFYTLFTLKSGLTYDLLGYTFQMDVSSAKRNQTLGLAVLKHTLNMLECLPERSFETVEEFEAYFKGHAAIILDGTEQRMQRPKGKGTQKAFFSGKKKHTPSNL